MERSVYDNLRRIEHDHWWFVGRRQILSDQIRRLRLPDDARILEVGCGTGGNLEMLSRFGAVVGLEPDEESRVYAKEVSGAPVYGGSLPAPLPDLGATFDLIAALDVIEHVEDDEGALAALSRLLKPSGKVLATVPAHPWMWSQHDVVHHHHRRYRKQDFVALFSRAGLRVRRVSYFNTLLFPPIALVRLAKMNDSGDDALPSPGVNRLLGTIFSMESQLLRLSSLPVGVSLLVIAEKEAARLDA